MFLFGCPVTAGYVLPKGWFIMMGTTTDLASALSVVGAARTKRRDGALVEDEVEVTMDPLCMVPWQGERSPHHNPYVSIRSLRT